MRIHQIFHVSLLKPYHPTQDEGRHLVSRPPPIADDNVFLAETLLDRRTVPDGRRTRVEYLVKWQGYPLCDATWEPASNLLGSDLKEMQRQMDQRYEQAAKDLTAARQAPAATAAQRAAATSAVRRSTRQRKPRTSLL